MVIEYKPAFKVRWLHAMSDNEIMEELLECFIVKYLVTHEDGWYKERHMHKHIGRGPNPMTPVYGCACCEAKTSRLIGCTECHHAWELTMVKPSWKCKVLAFNTMYRNWWWPWPAGHREQRKGKGKGRRQGRGNANGYQPQANGYQPQRPFVIDVPCTQALAPRPRFHIEVIDVPEAQLVEVPEAELVEVPEAVFVPLTNHPGLLAVPPGLGTHLRLEVPEAELAEVPETNHPGLPADLLAEHGEAACHGYLLASDFLDLCTQSESAVDYADEEMFDADGNRALFGAGRPVAPTVLDSPTESWTTTLDASGNEADDLFSMD